MATRNRIAESSIDSSDVALLEAAAERDHRDIIDHIARNLARNFDEEPFRRLSRP